MKEEEALLAKVVVEILLNAFCWRLDSGNWTKVSGCMIQRLFNARSTLCDKNRALKATTAFFLIGP